jgi:hypothetical protein
MKNKAHGPAKFSTQYKHKTGARVFHRVCEGSKNVAGIDPIQIESSRTSSIS